MRETEVSARPKKNGLVAAELNSTRLSVLENLSSVLDSALEALESPPITKDVGEGIDFYDEVRNFEINLISRALRVTHGSQIEAAALLGLRHTTLNSKIKAYHLDWRRRRR
jgi:DNA-binding NtrC family response regulator